MRIPTIKIACPANKRAGYAIINEGDFDPKKRERFDAKEAPRDDSGDTPTAADVLAMADGNFMAFKSAANKILGDDTPAKKDEIVAALQAKTEA